MRPRHAGTALLIALLPLAAATGCTRVGEPPSVEHEEAAAHDDAAGGAHGAGGEHENATPPATNDGEAVGTVEVAPSFVASERVVGRLGPGGKEFDVARRTSELVGHQRRIGRKTFSIALRSEKLTYYPCSSCHVAGRATLGGERVADVHQDIQPVHPAENNAVCSACHVVDDPEWLTLAGADPVPLNEAFRLCAQCHFIQVEAWAGGAHGKRLDTWRGPRVVMSCTDCHNPHRPGIPTRIPFPGPRVPRTGPKQP